MLTGKDLEYFQTVVSEYEKNHSIRDTAISLDISRVKVRKILITMGMLISPLTEQALAMKKEGMLLEDIAKALDCSVSTLSTYLPYEDRVYGREDKSDVAKRIEKYRERQQSAASMMREDRAVKELPDLANLSFGDEEIVYLKDKVKEEEKANSPFLYRGSMYLLRFELMNTHSQATVLRHMGKMKEGIIRDVYVPGDMPLHAVHYMIQRLFGWQNEHLHHFALTDEDFSLITGGKMRGYTDLCGSLFRFPEQDTTDEYWEDDYGEGTPITKWLRKKYRKPYRLLSVGDTYSDNQRKVKEFDDPDFDLLENHGFIYDKPVNQMLENLPIENVLLFGQRGDVHEWKGDIVGKIARKAEEKKISWDEEKEQLRMWRHNRSATTWYIHTRQEQHIQDLTGKNAHAFLQECNNRVDHLERITAHLFGQDRIKPKPFFNELMYEYDSGDGWKVKITCLKRYERNAPVEHRGDYTVISIFTEQDAVDKYQYFDGTEQVPEDLRRKFAEIDVYGRPLCIHADGLNVVENVGGVNGFADFLMTINGKDKEEAASQREWARGLGWTGRMSKPEKIL